MHSFWHFDKLVTNCTKWVHKTVLIWGTLEMGSMKYLWVSLGSSNKMRIAMFHEFGSFWTSYCTDPRDLSHGNHNYIYHTILTLWSVDVLALWNSRLRECILEINLARLQLTSFDTELLDCSVLPRCLISVT